MKNKKKKKIEDCRSCCRSIEWFCLVCYNFKLSWAGAEAVTEFLLLNCVELMWYDLICCCQDIYYHFEQLTILFKNNVCDCDYCCCGISYCCSNSNDNYEDVVYYRIVLYGMDVVAVTDIVAMLFFLFVSTKLYFICLPSAHLPLMLRK